MKIVYNPTDMHFIPSWTYTVPVEKCSELEITIPEIVRFERFSEGLIVWTRDGRKFVMTEVKE